jgi:alpha-tubulin suppressor-like RCC1 family protein
MDPAKWPNLVSIFSLSKLLVKLKIVFLTFWCLLGLEFEEDEFREVKRPKKLPMFDMNNALIPRIPIVKLACGGMHTAAITSSGAVFTWGCGDDGVLGHSGNEDLPGIAQVPIRCTDVSLGDSHTIFYNTESN